jgi:hypothetical protein
MTVTIELRCDACHGTSISMPLDGGDDSPVDCEDCGADLGVLADLKTLVTLQVLGRKKVCEVAWLSLLN